RRLLLRRLRQQGREHWARVRFAVVVDRPASYGAKGRGRGLVSLLRDLVRPRTSGPWIGGRGRRSRPPVLEAYRYERSGRAHRAHLRVDDDGGVLILDARRIVHLSAEGVRLAREILGARGAKGRPAFARDSD